jgi:hypothetical protein
MDSKVSLLFRKHSSILIRSVNGPDLPQERRRKMAPDLEAKSKLVCRPAARNTHINRICTDCDY